MSKKITAIAAALAVGALGAPALAQAPGPSGPETVTWTASAPLDAIRPGGRAAVVLRGTVVEGWHVYSLKQAADGPTPLRVTLAPSEIAAPAGSPSASAPVRKHDPSFGFDTAYYEAPFTVTVPVKVAAKAAAGRQAIPINVRFQTCNGAICQPPKTVKVTAPITVRTDG